MRDDVTAVTAIIDGSGSMASIKEGIIGGINKFIDDQNKLPGTVIFSMIQFDSYPQHEFCYNTIYNFVNLKEVSKLTDDSYTPRGGTPLHDALDKCIDEYGAKLAAIPETDRPSKVVLVIMTDGHENASRHATRESVMAKIKHQREKFNWQVVFMGANMDSVKESAGLGILRGATINYNHSVAGSTHALNMMSHAVGAYRTSTAKDFLLNINDEDEAK